MHVPYVSSHVPVSDTSICQPLGVQRSVGASQPGKVKVNECSKLIAVMERNRSKRTFQINSSHGKIWNFLTAAISIPMFKAKISLGTQFQSYKTRELLLTHLIFWFQNPLKMCLLTWPMIHCHLHSVLPHPFSIRHRCILSSKLAWFEHHESLISRPPLVKTERVCLIPPSNHVKRQENEQIFKSLPTHFVVNENQKTYMKYMVTVLTRCFI